MTPDRDTLLQELREYVLEVFFTKKSDGNKRLLRCTLRPDLLPPVYKEEADHKFHADNKSVLAVWDIQNGGWRSFDINTVEYAQRLDNF